MLLNTMGLEIFDTPLDTATIYQNWYFFSTQNNLGANATENINAMV